MWILAATLAFASTPLLTTCARTIQAEGDRADRGWACLGFAVGVGLDPGADEETRAQAREASRPITGGARGPRTARGVWAVLALEAREVTPTRLEQLRADLCRDAESCPAGHRLDVLLGAAVGALEEQVAPGEVRQRLREGVAWVAGVADRPGAELPEATDLSRWVGGLEEPLRLQLAGARSTWLDRTLRSTGASRAEVRTQSRPECAPELGSSCPRSSVPPGVDLYDMDAFARLYGRTATAPRSGAAPDTDRSTVTLLDVDTRGFAAAWRDVHRRQEPSEVLAFLARWVEVASARDLRGAASLDALRLLPALVELFDDTAPFARGGPVELAERTWPLWYRALAAQHAAGELEAAFRLQAALVGRRHRWGRALRVARDRPSAALQAAFRGWEQVERSRSWSTDLLLTTPPARWTSLAPGLLTDPEAARAAVLAEVPALPVPSLALTQAALRGEPTPSVLLILDGPAESPWVSVVTPDRWRREPIPTGPDEPALTEILARTNASLRDHGDGASLARDLHTLYRRLVAPVAADLPARGLVFVVATGPFSAVPFEALLEAAPEPGPLGPDWRAARFLGARLAWAHLPSVAWLTTPAPTTRGTVTLVVGKSSFVGDLPPLPGVLDELDAVRLRIAERAPLVWCDDGCTQPPTLDAVREVARRAALLHVATHSVGTGHPYLGQVGRSDGALVLSGGDGSPSPWRAADIERIEARADLVVLSACHTRVTGADPVFGELGLANAFLVAGARVVVASRWAIRDDAPRRFFSAFYERTLAGESPAWAIQAAQARLRARGDAHPSAWAAFTTSGIAPNPGPVGEAD